MFKGMFSLLKDIFSFGYYPAAELLYHNTNYEEVLLYHSVYNLSSRIDSSKINVKPIIFEKQAEFLSRLKNKNIILSFDDGYNGFFEHVLPLLLRLKLKSMLFVTTGFIDRLIPPDKLFQKKLDLKPLSWRQIKQIGEAGVEIGSHTITHPNLSLLDDASAQREISDSKKKIEDIVGKEVKYFAYPYGSRNSFNRRIKEIVQESGYTRAYANIMGFNTPGTDPYELKRIRIYSNDNMLRFKLKVKGSYNWVDFFKPPNFKK